MNPPSVAPLTTPPGDAPASDTKPQQLARVLRDRLMAMPGGGRLPSVRALMRRFQVSQHTVSTALQLLDGEELIVRKPGSGICRSNMRRMPRVVYCKPLSVMQLAESQERALHAACMARNWPLNVHRFDPTQAHLFDEDVHADGLILRPELVTFNSPLLARLLKGGVPRVVLGRDTSSAQLDFVTGDDHFNLRELIKGLVARGHRKIAFFVCEPPFHEIQERVKYFRQMCQLLDLEPCPVLDMEAKYGGDGISAAADFLRGYLASLPGKRKRLPFTALITCSSVGSLPALRAFHEAGFRVPEDCSLCCMGSDPSAQYFVPSITNAEPHQAQIAEGCLRILEKRLAGDKSPLLHKSIAYPPVWRESTGTARK